MTGIDTPTLRDVWASAPYLHNGSAATLADAVRAHSGVTVSDADLTKLVAYLSQIDDQEPAPVVPNGAPIVQNPGNQAGTVGTAVNLQIVASDPDSNPMTFSATGLPAGLAITANGLIFGSPTSVGNNSVTVTANDGQGATGSTSFSWSITNPAPPPDTTLPSAPGTVTASVVSSSQINLSWGAATDNVGVTGYQVERCQGTGCTTFALVTTVTTTSFNNTGLAASTTYRYRVRATDAAGNFGPYTAIATAATQAPPAPDTTAPSRPSGLTATAVSPSQINLSWGASTDNVGVTGYQVQRCTGSGCTNYALVATVATTSFNDTGRAASTTYRYRVRATDAAGNLGPFTTPIVSATTPAAQDTTAPGAPGALTSSAVSSSQVNLSWGAATDNVAVTGYQVERCQGAGCTTFTLVTTVTTTSFNNTGLAASTTYRFRVTSNRCGGQFRTVYGHCDGCDTRSGCDCDPCERRWACVHGHGGQRV